MRLLDIISHWAKNTHASYFTKIKQLQTLESTYDLHFLTPTHLIRPPKTPDTSVMRCQEAYSVKLSTKRKNAEATITVAFGAIP